MEVEREKLKLQELINDIKFACRKGAYHNSLSLRSLACCFLPESDPQRIRNVAVDNRLRCLIAQYAPKQEATTVASQVTPPNESTDTVALLQSPTAMLESPTSPIEPLGAPSTTTDLTEALAVLNQFEPVLFHAISGYLRQKHDRAESVCLELLVVLKAAMLSPEGASRFESNFRDIVVATDSGRKYIDLVHLKALAEHESALDAQPSSKPHWVCLHSHSTNDAISHDGATISADLSNPSFECINFVALGWRPHTTGSRSFSIHATQQQTSDTPSAFRVGWTCLKQSHRGVFLGDDAYSIGFDGRSVFCDYQCIASLATPIAAWSDVTCQLILPSNLLTFTVEAQAVVSVPVPQSLRGMAVVPAVAIGKRTFLSTVWTRYSSMYPSVFSGLGYLGPVPLSSVPTNAQRPVELVGDCTEFSSMEGTMTRLHPSIELSPKAWTISFFLYPLATQDNSEPRPWRTIFLKGQDQTMERTASVFLSCDRLLLAVCVSTKSDWNSTLVSSGPLTANQWTHIAVVCDGLTLRLIIQGKEDRTLSLNDAAVHNNHPFYFGKSPPGVKKATTDYKGFRGYLKHLQLYPTRACSVKEIAKFVKDGKHAVQSTDLEAARRVLAHSTIDTTQTLELTMRSTPGGADDDSLVEYFAPASGGVIKVPSFFQSVVKWPAAFHIQMTVRMHPSVSRASMQVLAACASSDGAFAFVWGVTANGQLCVRTKDRKFTTTGRYISPTSSWFTVGWSYTLSNVVFFIDGHAVETMPSGNVNLDLAQSSLVDLYIGGVPFECNFAEQWAGDLGGVKVFRHDPRTSQSTIAHYMFSEGHGTVVYDKSSTLHARAVHEDGWRTEPSLKHAQPPTRSSLVVESSSVPLTVRILSFLESMAMIYLTSFEVEGVDGMGGTESGAVWTHVLTFLLLHSLIRQVFAQQGDPHQGQAIVALVRVLRANFKPLSSIVSTDLSVPIAVPPASVGLGISDATSFAQRLKDLLVELSAFDVEFVDEAALKEIHHEAILTQIAGTEIFHPTAQKRADRLIKALECPVETEELCRYLLSQRHLVMQFLPFPDLNKHSALFPWTVEHVQNALLDAKSLTTDDVAAVLERFQKEPNVRSMAPEQLVVLYETWHLYYRDNHCQLSQASFKQLWKALVQHAPAVSGRPSSLVDLVSFLQSQLIQNLLPDDKWDIATISRLRQWHAPRRYFKVVNCPIGVRAMPNVKAPKIGKTLNIGQVIESNHVIRMPDDAVLYVSYGDGWVFDVDPSDGMLLLEEQVLNKAAPVEPTSTRYSLCATMEAMVHAKEATSTKGWLQFEAVGAGGYVNSTNPTTVTCESDDNWMCAFGNKFIRQGSGVYTWRLQVNKCANVGQLVVGLAAKSTSLDNFCLGTSHNSYGWMLTGDFYHNGKRTKATTLPLFGSKNVPVIDLTVNTTANTLVVCNADTGVQYGPSHALELVAGEEYYPAVSLYRRDDSVSWLSPILFLSELSPTEAVPSIEPTPLAIYCAKQLISVYRDAIHQGIPLSNALRSMVAQVVSNMCLWTSMLDERDSFMDLIEDILVHGEKATTDDVLTLGCFAGQLFGEMIYGVELEHMVGPELKWVQSKLFNGGAAKRTENTFLNQFIDGSCSNLDKTMLRFVGGSALVLRMGGPNLDRAIRGVIASMLFHCGMTVSAESLDVDTLKLPPKALRLIWQKAVELKAWALRYKTSANTTYDEIAAMLTSKVDLLLSLMPCKSEEYVGTEPPSLSRRISMGSKRSGSFDAAPEDAGFPDWEDDLLQAIYGFYKDSDCSVKRIQEVLSSSHLKAVTRVSGLRRATSVLHSTNVAIPVKAAVLLHLVDVLRSKSAHLWHYQHGIAGCPVIAKLEAHRVFEGFYQCITQLLTSGNDDVSWQLVLLDASALRILPEDHIMLASCRVFQALQEILDRTGDSPSLVGLRQATMKVVYLLALQVASEGESDTHINSLSPPHFKRQLSGPQTLSANVFDILYSEMSAAVTSMLEVDTNATYRLDTIGSNSTILGVLSLLQFVSTSVVCQNFLCTPNWLSLFLTTACFGVTEPHTRAMHLLHTLLPLCDPSFLGIDLLFDLTTLACVSTSCRAMPLLEFFLDTAGMAMMPLESSRTQLPRSAESFLSLASESVSVLRMLMVNETWTDLVAQCLTESYNSTVPSKKLGVLAVMGSFPEPLRFGGHVELQDGSRATVVGLNSDKQSVQVQKNTDQTTCTLAVDSVTVVARESLPMAAFPPALVNSILGQTAQLVDSVYFLHHFQVARLIYNEDPSRLIAFVADYPAMALKVFDIGATLTDTNGLLSLPQLEDKSEIIRSAQYTNTYGTIRDAMFPVSQTKAAAAPVDEEAISTHGTARLGFAEGVVCTMKQVSTFDVPVDMDPRAIAWMEALLNHILSLTVSELTQMWATTTTLNSVNLGNVQQAVEKVYGQIQLPEMLQAACAEANEWLSNRDHWGNEWTVHEASIVQFVLAQLTHNQISIEEWSKKCASLKVGSYLCATCECLVADVLSLAIEVMRNADTATPVVTVASILEAMRGDEELGRLLRFHESFLAQQQTVEASPSVPVDKTSDEKLLDVRIQSMITMGFPETWCRRALDESGQDVNAALNWILMNGDLLQETVGVEAPLPTTPPIEVATTTPVNVVVDEGPRTPSVAWSTDSTVEATGPYSTFWNLEDEKATTFTVRCRTGALVGLFSSPSTLRYEIRISDKSIELYYDGAIVCSDAGAFCDELAGVAYWVVHTAEAIYVGQGSHVNVEDSILHWKRTDSDRLDCCSFASSAAVVSVFNISMAHAYAPARDGSTNVTNVVVVAANRSGQDFTFCFCDGQSANQATTELFNVWGADGTRRGFMDAMAQENAAGLLQHASDMARVLRILYARRLGLTILAICRSSLGSIFHNHEQLFVEFVSLVSNRQWISDIAVNQPLQWYLPRKQTSEDVLRPAIQFICATKNPLSSALCAYMQAQMTAFLQNPTALHWTDPAHLKTDVGVRQGADLRFVLLVTQWLLPVSNVIEHSLFRTWTASLASTHLNVQQTALQVLSHLLDQSLAAGDTDALQLYTNLLSFPHLKAVTARLLQAEQENFPVYSQYLQAHVDFLALCDRALQQLDEAARPTAPHFELFFKGAASCIVLNADAVSPPWTAQYSVRPRAGGATAVLANSNSTSIQLRCGKLFDGRPSLAIKTKLNGKLYPFRCSVPDDTWSVVTITASLSAVSVYINGTFAAQVDAPNVYLPLEHIGDTTHGFRGWIANVRYFESQLTSHQVQVLATNDLAQCQREAVVTAATFDSIVPALTAIGHWPLHEGGGSIVRDSLQRFSDVAVQGVEWTRMMDKNTNATATSPIDSQLSAEHLEDHLVFSGTGTFAQHPCGPLGGGWNQPTTKALALRLYSVDQVRLDGVVEVNSTVRCLVQGKAQSDGFVEFSIVARRGGNDDDNAQWMDGVTFHGWHRKGTLKGTWSASITQTIPPRHDPPMYFLPPTTDSVVLSDGGRLAMSVLRKNKKKASVLYMGFGSAGIQQTWASNGIPTSDLTIAAQHEILNRTDGFATVRCNTMVNCGKVYFELTLRTGGLMQLGFVCPDFKPAFSTHGVGDHFGSYAVDGKRHKKWCNVGSVYGGDWSWSAGDVVGAMVDFDNGTVSFSHQGIDLGVAFTEHECPQIKWSNGFFPAGSFSNGEGASFNLGQVPFQYQPPPGYVSVLEAASMPTPGHVELYSHRQKVFEAISSCHRVAQATCPFPRQTISYGVYHWEIQISSLTATDGIRVGVCIEGVNPTLLLGEDRFGWGLCASGKVYHSSTAQRYASVGFVQGDRVGIELNMYKGTLGYYRNRIHLGDAFTNLNLELPMTAYLMANSVGGFVPAVSFFRPQSMVVCLGLKEGRDDIQYVKKNRAFSGQWKQGQREGDGKLHLTHTEGFYMGSWVDNELEGAALWCEPFPLCVPTMYPDVWKRLGFLRAPDHLVCGIRYDVFRRGAVVETGTPLPTAHIVTTNRASPCLKRAQPVPSTSSWYTSIHTCLRFAMAQTSRQPTGPPKQPTTTSISIDGTWQADAHQRFVLIPPSPLYDSVSIAGDLTSAKLESHASSGNHVLFRGNIGISSGVHYWEVGIQACNHGSLFIGIASSQIKPSEGWGDYGFVSYRVRWSQAEGEHLYGRYFSAGDTIGVRFDMEEGTLSFTKDGDDFTRGRPAVIHMGVAFRNLRSQNSSHNLTFVPVVGCSQPGDAFTVKSYKWHSQTKARWPLARLERALDAASVILDDFPNQSIVQHATALYHSFKTMGEFQPRRFWTRGGTRIELTNAMLDRAIARLQGHDRFTLRHGEALVLGEKDGVIWYVIQGEEAAGAWYWTESEIAHLLTINPSEIPSEPWSCVACTMLNDVNLSKCQICDTPHEVPLEETADIDDEMLAYEALIAPATSSNTTTSSVPSIQGLLNGWSPATDLILVHEMDALCDDLGQDPENMPWSDFWNCVQPLVEFNEDQVAARLSALLAWNAHVEWLLPFLDFHGQSVLEGPISRTANKLAHARHLIFKRIKMAFWKDVLAFTTTHTTPPSDEYERPESLREVPVNRILALNEQASFKNSVFGQLYEAMHAWDNRSLRRAYADELQDAGQRRAFYVKFLGEGVDDHGGPYRAVFQTGAWDEPSGNLKVFVPCPNAVTGGGMNQDKFVISTNASASHLTFLGKLIGMAARHRIMVPLNCSDLLWKPLVGLAMDRKDLTSVDTMLMRELHDLECLGDAEVEALDPEEVIEYLLRVTQAPRNPHMKKWPPFTCASLGRVIDACVALKLDTIRRQVVSFMEGLGAVLPYALFNLFTPAQFEELVCGSPHIDIDMLQRITVYEGVDATAPHIAFFWNCLEDMNQDQRSAFVNFVLARSRLPRSIEEFTLHFKIQPAIFTGDDTNPDHYLPHSQTCFFSLSLPRYSSKEICMEKLLYAIHNSPTMDADFVERGSAGWEHTT